MKKHLILSLILVLFTPVIAWPQGQPQTTLPQQNIRLKDGTVIKGHLVGVSGDHYVIDSTTVGQVQVKISELESITTGTPSMPSVSTGTPLTGVTANLPPAQPGQPLPQQLQEMQRQMLSDPEVSSMLQDLANDPEIQKLVQDPTLLQSALSMDPQQIQGNANVQKLLQHPKMQRLMELMGRKLSDQQVPDDSSPSR